MEVLDKKVRRAKASLVAAQVQFKYLLEQQRKDLLAPLMETLGTTLQFMKGNFMTLRLDCGLVQAKNLPFQYNTLSLQVAVAVVLEVVVTVVLVVQGGIVPLWLEKTQVADLRL